MNAENPARGVPAAHATGPGTDCQVLVVGAGPTGLVLGAELLARGVRTRIIDKGDEAAVEARAIGLHARTLEILDMMGLSERFVERGQIVRQMRFYSQGRCLAGLDFGRCGSRFGMLLDIPQDQTELLLRDRVAELGGTIEHGTELTGLGTEADSVTAAVRRGGQAGTITAGYVVGCDGAHSRVRHELGLAFHGQPYPQDWLLADVLMDWELREDAVHAFFRPDGLPLICFPMREHRWRLTLPFAGGRNGRPVTLAEIQELTGQRAPVAVSLSDPSWLAAFRCHRRSTDCYRRGRVLLAGDSVHIHTPAGGQGLNTGIADAHNLAWKLALVASCRAPDVLLDSYGRERRPVADEVLKLTHALIRSGTVSHPVKRRARDIIVPPLARVPVVQRRAARRISQVYVAYPPAPLTGTGHRPAGLGCWRSAPWTKPGQRAPDMRVRWGGAETTLHRVLRTGRHVLVLPVADAVVLADAGLRPYRAELEIVTRAPADARGSGRGSALAVLVRPDGYVAARGRPDRLQAVTGYLRDLLGNPPGAPRRVPRADVLVPGPAPR